ncbi:MAG: MaoC family dehydratase [Hydrogenophaga sp.]|uniref:MaoC family dehydratase n=1 Tax=Hydrogenophaga sp. TaxID=1904254 RepID=UPI00271F0C5A|nr:MaoC family dehydratase [Hydrogenophaga sp.]MDO9504262.1 MaoC family dehydratase [Hydrogenophaga sp.]MDZ4283908.1 MaoC family dehydratase [Hydrogenophaga sp.]
MSIALQTVALTADPEVILAYGKLTDDMNPIHIDPVYAATTPMGGCIAHGTMSIGLLWQSLFRTFGEVAPQRVDLDVRFIKPVRVGETIHAGGELRDGETDCYSVWVRGDDGADRMTGTLRLLHEEALA